MMCEKSGHPSYQWSTTHSWFPPARVFPVQSLWQDRLSTRRPTASPSSIPISSIVNLLKSKALTSPHWQKTPGLCLLPTPLLSCLLPIFTSVFHGHSTCPTEVTILPAMILLQLSQSQQMQSPSSRSGLLSRAPDLSHSANN